MGPHMTRRGWLLQGVRDSVFYLQDGVSDCVPSDVAVVCYLRQVRSCAALRERVK